MDLRASMQVFRGHRVPHLRIIEHRNWWFSLSGSLVVISIAGLLLRGGLTLSIDFEGGALLKYPDKSGVTVAQVNETLSNHGLSGSEVQIVNGEEVTIRTKSLGGSNDDKSALLGDLAKQAGIGVNDMNSTIVGPTWGQQISSKALKGLIIFLVLVTLYIAFRFEWKMALSAQTALIHDIVITVGVFALTGREVTPATVIAFLTILGYSLYDTVVIFDKVKENTESAVMIARDSYAGVVNTSLNQTLMRSVNTSLVVLLPILSLLLFGGDTLKDFAFALFIGVASGTYSSIFMASPLLAVLKEREPRYRQLRDKKAATRAAKKREVEPDEDLTKELQAAGVVKRSPQPGPSATRSGGKGSGGSKNKKTTAKQRRRR